MKITTSSVPNYKLIYLDILQSENKETKEKCQLKLLKQDLSVLDIIEINQKIFGVNSKNFRFNQK